MPGQVQVAVGVLLLCLSCADARKGSVEKPFEAFFPVAFKVGAVNCTTSEGGRYASVYKPKPGVYCSLYQCNGRSIMACVAPREPIVGPFRNTTAGRCFVVAFEFSSHEPGWGKQRGRYDLAVQRAFGRMASGARSCN